jgi:hypothetical protein
MLSVSKDNRSPTHGFPDLVRHLRTAPGSEPRNVSKLTLQCRGSTRWFPDLKSFLCGNDCAAHSVDSALFGDHEKEDAVKRLLFAATAAVALAAAAPASAQVYLGADSGGAGVRVGPFGLGVGPDYGWRDPYWRGHDAYAYRAYGPECRVIQQRVVTPGGRVIFRTHRVCD